MEDNDNLINEKHFIIREKKELMADMEAKDKVIEDQKEQIAKREDHYAGIIKDLEEQLNKSKNDLENLTSSN